MQKIKAYFIFAEFVVTVAVVIFFMWAFNSRNWYFRKAWGKLQSKLIGYKVNIKGKIDPDAQMIMMNHQSLLDIVVLEGLYPKDIAWVAKKEIRDIPFFGQVLSLPKMIIIERENRKSLVKLLKESKDRVEKGRVIGIFPEGTRGDGKSLKKFRAGAKLIAQKLNLRVQPVVIINSREILDSQNFIANNGDVTVRFLDSINPNSSEDWYEKTHAKMQEVLLEELKAT